jgi:hypothetical protein
MLLAVHEAIRDVVPSKSLEKLGPRHLIGIKNGGGEGHPPRTHRLTKLLGHCKTLCYGCPNYYH